MYLFNSSKIYLPGDGSIVLFHFLVVLNGTRKSVDGKYLFGI